MKRSLLCRRFIKDEELLKAGSHAERTIGSFRRVVSVAIHPDKNPGMGEVMKNFNHAVDQIRNDAQARNCLDGGFDLVDQQVAYRAPFRFVAYPRDYPMMSKLDVARSFMNMALRTGDDGTQALGDDIQA
ncbi:MAG: hypothetical protein GY768_10655, partial [Planctomycetaceae bacterium]|nr:hypothetical protein [Planctomycetaceae bacterium]